MIQKPEGFLEKVKGFFSNSKDKKGTGTDVYGIHNSGMHGIFELKTTDSKPYCKESKNKEEKIL